MKLQYDKPAYVWTEGLPIGNGRLGGMIFGGVEQEKISLNEDTLWSGYPKDGDNPGAKNVLPKVRQLIQEGRYVEADTLTREMMYRILNLIYLLVIYCFVLSMATSIILISVHWMWKMRCIALNIRLAMLLIPVRCSLLILISCLYFV